LTAAVLYVIHTVEVRLLPKVNYSQE